MEITKKIKISVERKGKRIICGDLPTLQMVLGTCGVSGNLHIYRVEKKLNKYYVPIEVVQNRLTKIKNDIDKLIERRDIIKQIVK